MKADLESNFERAQIIPISKIVTVITSVGTAFSG